MRTLVLTLLLSISFYCNAQEISKINTTIYEKGAHLIESSINNQIVFIFKNAKFKDIVINESIVYDSPESSVQFFEKIVEMLQKEAPSPEGSIGANLGDVFLNRYGSFPTVVRVDTQKGFTYVSKRNALQIIEVLKLKVKDYK